MKKILGTSLMVLLLMITTVTTGYAQAGWQRIGGDIFYPRNTSGSWNSTSWDSLGGVFKAVDGGNVGFNVCVSFPGTTTWNTKVTPKLEVMVYEDDGGLTGDDWIATINFDPRQIDGCSNIQSVQVGNHADGTNGVAEIQLKYTWNFHTEDIKTNVYD
jgi:hypothetical protein